MRVGVFAGSAGIPPSPGTKTVFAEAEAGELQKIPPEW